MNRPARWAAMLLVVALGVGSVAMLSSGQTTPNDLPLHLPTTVSASSTTVNSSSVESTHASVPPTVSSTTEAPISDDPLETLRSGLTAWGQFAVSGDLEVVAPWFHPDGPQWAQFRHEAPGLAADPIGPPPYTVTMEHVDTESGGQKAKVSARVVFVRPGEPSQSFRWVITLRPTNQSWWIWTVDRSDDPADAAPSP